jgi:uncharacterized membrane protein YeaQ/YmgE (transglycosylase-associated protein family)
MSTAVFVVIGLAACGFTRGLFNSTVPGVLLDLCLGVIGAVIGGSLFNYIVGMGTARLGIASTLLALAGAAVMLAAYHGMVYAAHRLSQLPGSAAANARGSRWTG